LNSILIFLISGCFFGLPAFVVTHFIIWIYDQVRDCIRTEEQLKADKKAAQTVAKYIGGFIGIMGACWVIGERNSKGF
jgi:hypothetical protein